MGKSRSPSPQGKYDDSLISSPKKPSMASLHNCVSELRDQMNNGNNVCSNLFRKLDLPSHSRFLNRSPSNANFNTKPNSPL